MAISFFIASSDVGWTGGGPGVNLNFLTGYLKLKDDTWETQTPGETGEYSNQPYGASYKFGHFNTVRETFTIRGKETATRIRQVLALIDNAFELSRQARDPLSGTMPSYLCVQTDGEQPRLALIYNGSRQDKGGVGLSPLLADVTLDFETTITLTRAPFWEDSGGLQTFVGLTWATACFAQFPPSILGTVPARIAELRLDHPTVGGALTKFWVGFRDEYSGIASFSPVVELELGTLGTDASLANDASASPSGAGNNMVQISFASPGLAKRQSVKISQLTVQPSMYRGRYLALLRCKCDVGSTFGVQVQCGIGAAMTPNEERFDVTNTTWKLIDMGTIQIPPTSLGGGLLIEPNVEIQVWAERLTGAGKLYLDAILLLPSDHMVSIQGASVLNNSNDTVYAVTNEVGENGATNYVSGVANLALQTTFHDFYLPVGEPVIVVAMERADAHYLTDEIHAVVTYEQRWRSVRSV